MAPAPSIPDLTLGIEGLEGEGEDEVDAVGYIRAAAGHRHIADIAAAGDAGPV